MPGVSLVLRYGKSLLTPGMGPPVLEFIFNPCVLNTGCTVSGSQKQLKALMRGYITKLERQRQADAERLQQGFDDAVHKHRADIAEIVEIMSSGPLKLPVLAETETRQALDDVAETRFFPSLTIPANQELDRIIAAAEDGGEQLDHQVVAQELLSWYKARNQEEHQRLQNAGNFLSLAHDNEVLRYKSMLREVSRRMTTT
jgi:hypothetical protein